MRQRIHRTVWVTVMYALLLLVVLVGRADASEVGCYTADITGETEYIIVEIDEGVQHARVGDYMWIRYSHEVSDSYDNVLSYHIEPGFRGLVTVCTTYIAEGIIPIGPGMAETVEVSGTATSGTAVVYSTLDPHPAIADAWITANGLIVL